MDTRKRSIKDLKDNLKSLESRFRQARREFGRAAATAAGAREDIQGETLAELDLIESAVMARKARSSEVENFVRELKSVRKEIMAGLKVLRSLAPHRARMEFRLGEYLHRAGSDIPAFKGFKRKCEDVEGKIAALESLRENLNADGKRKGVFKAFLSGGKAAIAAVGIKARRKELESILKEAGKSLFADLAAGKLNEPGLESFQAEAAKLSARDTEVVSILRKLESEEAIALEGIRSIAGDTESRRFLSENKREIKRLEAETDTVFVSIADEVRARDPANPGLAEILVLETAIKRDAAACARLERAREFDALAVKRAKLESRLNSLSDDEESKVGLKRKLAGEIAGLDAAMSTMPEYRGRSVIAMEDSDDFTVPDLD